MKYFIITIDTEGDDLWNYKKGQVVETVNSLYIPRFQELCEKYDFKPVWLTNYEMAQDSRYVDYIKPKLLTNKCEVGIHIHAWNNPPLFEIDKKYNGNPYLIEYPYDIMKAKFKLTYDLLYNKFGVKPISHRAGRWAMNSLYFELLKEFDVKVDCSFTPGIDWSKNYGQTIGGSDYSNMHLGPQIIDGILEMPVSILKLHCFNKGSYLHRIKNFIKGDYIWLRPAASSYSAMIRLVKELESQNNEQEMSFLEFMIHSSELMPGGSPYFNTVESIEREYEEMDRLFSYLKNKGYVGITFEEYYKIYSKNNELV